jgi:hypothetical protein
MAFCADGALGTDEASCAHPAGIIEAARKKAAVR